MDVRVTYRRVLGENLYRQSEDIFENAEFTVNKIGLCRIMRDGKQVAALRGWAKVEYGGEEKLGVDMGGGTCSVCHNRYCKCPERQPNRTWKMKNVVTKEGEYQSTTNHCNACDDLVLSFRVDKGFKNAKCTYEVEE
jgi:hypothetical protein